MSVAVVEEPVEKPPEDEKPTEEVGLGGAVEAADMVFAEQVSIMAVSVDKCPERITEKAGVFFSPAFLASTYEELEKQGLANDINRNSLDGAI